MMGMGAGNRGMDERLHDHEGYQRWVVGDWVSLDITLLGRCWVFGVYTCLFFSRSCSLIGLDYSRTPTIQLFYLFTLHLFPHCPFGGALGVMAA